MSVLFEMAIKLLKKGYVCDHCLGRQFAQLLSGMDNKERGRAIRTVIAMSEDANEKYNLDVSNYAGIHFHMNKAMNVKIPDKKEKKCYLCDDIMEKLDEIAKNVAKELENYEYNSFLIGVKLPEYLENREMEVWDEIGNEYAESLRNELSREIGKRVQKLSGKEVDMKTPDITVILNLQRNVVELIVSSLYIYGRYNKYKEMPQARWICRHCNGIGCKRCEWKGKMYEDSVQERIGDVLLEMTKGIDTSFHGAGREDIDALCTGWREFVIEIHEPRKRSIDLKKAEREINRKNKGIIEVKDLKIVDKNFVRTLKAKRTNKIYEVVISLEGKPTKSKIKELVGKEITLAQKTPQRVAHRRADKVRKRKVLILDAKLQNNKKLWMKIKTEAGTYVKEFVSGDEGRTKPSLSEMLGMKAHVEKLIVSGFEDEW